MEIDFFIRKDICKTGIPDIDRGYEELFTYLNDLFVCISSDKEHVKVKNIIKNLTRCSKELFMIEQKYIDTVNLSDSEADQHLLEHNDFLNRLELLNAYKKSDNVQNFIFIDYVRHWIIDHLLVSDRKLAISVKTSVMNAA